MTRAAAFIFTLFLAFAVAQPALAQKRIALVIGNAAYSGKLGKLDNPLNDIALVAKSLRSVGFEVMEPVENANRSQLLLAIYEFAARLKAAGRDSVGFFYYAGHGIAAGGANYLIPVDVKSLQAQVLNVDGVRLDDITRLLRDNAPDADHFVVFDACRNKLLGARGSRGFKPEQGRAGMFIAFSSAPDQTAEDGDGQNGPYATALANELLKPRQDHLHLFQNVKESVIASTGTQVPWERNGLRKRLYFGGDGAGQTATPKEPASLSEAAREWASLRDSKDAGDLQAYIAQFGKAFPYYGRKAKKRLKKLKEKKVAVGVGVILKKRPAQPGVLRPGTIFDDCNGAGWCPSMVVVPTGSFMMGSPGHEKKRSRNEGPRRIVQILHPFAVGRFEISQKQYSRFIEDTSYTSSAKCQAYNPRKRQWAYQYLLNYQMAARQPTNWRLEYPVVCISWYDAKAFVEWLARKTGKKYRLLSEAEWEFVARSGSDSPYWWGRKIEKGQANYNNPVTYLSTLTEVIGSFKPNYFGIYNVHGNVWEWVEDCYHKNYVGAPRDSSAWVSGKCNKRIMRGGSWVSKSALSRTAFRGLNKPSISNNAVGVRVARSLSPSELKIHAGNSTSSGTCITLARKIPSRIKLTVGMRFCDVDGRNEAKVIKIANRAVVFSDNGDRKTCTQGTLCAFDWPVKPLFRIKARADRAKGIAPQATMEPRR